MKKYTKPVIIEEIIELEDVIATSTRFGGTQAGDETSVWGFWNN